MILKISDEVLIKATDKLRVLVHPDRLRICRALLLRDCVVGELCKELDLKQNVVSQHLNHLRAHGIVAARREGRFVHYAVIHAAPRWLLECISHHSGQERSNKQAKKRKGASE
jgi:ArsR family transcriptional regulator